MGFVNLKKKYKFPKNTSSDMSPFLVHQNEGVSPAEEVQSKQSPLCVCPLSVHPVGHSHIHKNKKKIKTLVHLPQKNNLNSRIKQ